MKLKKEILVKERLFQIQKLNSLIEELDSLICDPDMYDFYQKASDKMLIKENIIISARVNYVRIVPFLLFADSINDIIRIWDSIIGIWI